MDVAQHPTTKIDILYKIRNPNFGRMRTIETPNKYRMHAIEKIKLMVRYRATHNLSVGLRMESQLQTTRDICNAGSNQTQTDSPRAIYPTAIIKSTILPTFPSTQLPTTFIWYT